MTLGCFIPLCDEGQLQGGPVPTQLRSRVALKGPGQQGKETRFQNDQPSVWNMLLKGKSFPAVPVRTQGRSAAQGPGRGARHSRGGGLVLLPVWAVLGLCTVSAPTTGGRRGERSPGTAPAHRGSGHTPRTTHVPRLGGANAPPGSVNTAWVLHECRPHREPLPVRSLTADTEQALRNRGDPRLFPFGLEEDSSHRLYISVVTVDHGWKQCCCLWLCDHREVTYPLCAPISSPVQWGK